MSVMQLHSLFAIAKFVVFFLDNDEADTQSLASDFVTDNRDKKCTHGEAICRTSVCGLLSTETRTDETHKQRFLVITI